jgi:undecaprenyl diphosphate synthase
MPKFPSSTRDVPPVGDIPRHIAIIMDGNGRWAKQRMLPRAAGHQRGVETLRKVVKACAMLGVQYLTLFAFSSENWRRPAEEVSLLKQLFMLALDQEVSKLHRNGIRLRVIGDIEPFGEKIVARVVHAEKLTAANPSLCLTIAANYGGRWDLLQAMNRMLAAHPLQREAFTEEQLAQHLCMNYAPEPDLFIRTGGEQRISNFLLWQLAYTELYFTDTLWPDFDATALTRAIESYQQRERRFGRTSEQVAGVRESVPAKQLLA